MIINHETEEETTMIRTPAMIAADEARAVGELAQSMGQLVKALSTQTDSIRESNLMIASLLYLSLKDQSSAEQAFIIDVLEKNTERPHAFEWLRRLLDGEFVEPKEWSN